MKVLDLRQSDTKCGSNSPALSIMRFWLSEGGGQEIEIIALKGLQADQVEMWAEAMKEKGVKILSKSDEGDKIVYKVYLP
ncbi:hypothetical protein SJAV_15790 [Sulfurisphaera javensis]|uniref:Uncharacterized protein n=1 Tax=Sulfurisphaera javensis TaxID=2049879 RepID=A0AAT9GSF7_9CREN